MNGFGTDLGINPQAMAVLYLVDRLCDFEEMVICNASAWYNGRERGVCFRVASLKAPTTDKRACLNIIVYEHRNSDEMCAVRWWTPHLALNPPTMADVPEDAFPDKYSVTYSVPWGHAGEMAEWIAKEVETHLAKAGAAS